MHRYGYAIAMLVLLCSLLFGILIYDIAIAQPIDESQPLRHTYFPFTIEIAIRDL